MNIQPSCTLVFERHSTKKIVGKNAGLIKGNFVTSFGDLTSILLLPALRVWHDTAER